MNPYNRVNFLMFTLGLILSSLALFGINLLNLGIPIYILCIPFILLNFIHLIRILPFLLFEGPKERKDPFKEGNWVQVVTRIPGKRIAPIKAYFSPKSIENQVATSVNTYVIDAGEGSPMVMILHGWNSSPHASARRAQHFIDSGWTVVLFEMRGHCSNYWSGLWNGERIRKDVESAIVDVENHIGRLVSQGRTVFYGHSFGGFVGIRILDTNSQGFSELILESPMTMYSDVFRMLCKQNLLLRLTKPFVKRRLPLIWSRLHPNSKINSLEDTDVPNWGFPTVPALVVQAENDDLLGRLHYDAYVNCIEDRENNRTLEYHLLDSLNHSASGINATRDATIKMWIRREGDSLFLD